MRARLSAALASALLLTASLASARPAVVRLFEAKLHAKPEAGAAILGVVIEGQRLSVSEEAEGGWRRVRLADGAVAWIRDEALSLEAQRPPGEAPPAAPLPAAPPAAAVDPATPAALPALGPAVALPPGVDPPAQPAIWVDDLDGLRAAVAAEPALVAEVDTLAAREQTGQWIFWSGLAVGVGLALVPSLIAIAKDERPHPAYYYGGGGVLLATQAAAWYFSVGEHDLRPVAEAYNAKHPEPRLAVGSPPDP